MGTDIHIPADKVWSFFQKNKNRLTEEMVAIAENTDTEYAVYLTEDNGYPLFSVCKGKDAPEYEEGAINERDCTATAKQCYTRYLFPVVVADKRALSASEDEAEDLTIQDKQDEMYEREDELELALCDFLQVVLEEDENEDIRDTYGRAMVDEILDYFLEYLGFEQCLPIRRPMFLTDDETGSEVYAEYPYGDPFDETDESEFGNEGWE